MSIPALQLDLVRSARPSWLAVLGLVLAASLLISLQLQSANLGKQSQALEASLTQSAKSHKPARPDTEPMTAELQKHYASAHAVAAFLQLPWRDLFAALELAASDEVALIAIEPDPRKQVLHISADARDFAAMVDYLKRLQDAPQFSRVYLQRYQVNDDALPLRFNLEASWRLAQ